MLQLNCTPGYSFTLIHLFFLCLFTSEQCATAFVKTCNGLWKHMTGNLDHQVNIFFLRQENIFIQI